MIIELIEEEKALKMHKEQKSENMTAAIKAIVKIIKEKYKAYRQRQARQNFKMHTANNKSWWSQFRLKLQGKRNRKF